MTYGKVTTLDRFWDVLSEQLKSLDLSQSPPGELLKAFLRSNFESMLEK